jgi:pimeloyl-ACP methyl ester carboxylesterase
LPPAGPSGPPGTRSSTPRLEQDLHRAAAVRHVVIPNATHYVHLDQPEAGRSRFVADLLSFLAG